MVCFLQGNQDERCQRGVSIITSYTTLESHRKVFSVKPDLTEIVDLRLIVDVTNVRWKINLSSTYNHRALKHWSTFFKLAVWQLCI